MAVQFKLGIKRGQKSEDVTVGAGTTISGSDAIEINIDQTNMTEREVIVLLDEVKKQILQSPWPQA